MSLSQARRANKKESSEIIKDTTRQMSESKKGKNSKFQHQAARIPFKKERFFQAK
jgi:hypothetical protein